MIELLTSGFYSSIQDHGRHEFTNFGVPHSGVMDKHLSKFANLIIGNSAREAQIEMTLLGPKLKFLDSTMIAVGAYKANVYLNNQLEKLNHQIFISPGDILEVKSIQSRAYLAVSGGLKSELVLGSRSQYQNITKSSTLKKGDLLDLNQKANNFNTKYASINLDLSLYKKNTLYVYPLPEFELLDRKQKEFIGQNTFSISKNSNRMAYQLNETVENNLKGISSKPVMPGTVQLTPHGKLIILMRDAQVTGGYPRVLQMSEQSLNNLAQKGASQNVNFKIITPYENK